MVEDMAAPEDIKHEMICGYESWLAVWRAYMDSIDGE